MAKIYNFTKNYPISKISKISKFKFLAPEQVKLLLDTVVKINNKYKHRDHAAIFLGYYFGLRIGECVLLDKNSFRDIEHGVAHIKTLKSAPRIKFKCTKCNKRFLLSYKRAQQEFKCPGCGDTSVLNQSRLTPEEILIEKSPPVIEKHVIEYIKLYIESMLPEQIFLFENSRTHEHLSIEEMRKIFNSYLILSGLDLKYSWHALRHGRGVFIWERFEDVNMVREMLRQKSISSAQEYIHMSPARANKLQEALDNQALKVDFPK